MIDKEKIIIMSKMAVYDKNRSESDWKKDQYFRHDYIYRQNMWIRLFVFFGCLIVILFYILYKFAYDPSYLLSLNIKAEIGNMIAFVVITEIIYTIIGLIKYTADYERSQKQLRHYFSLMNRLERHENEKRKRLYSKEVSTRRDDTTTFTTKIRH